ncbi:unnamed protein product [Zymoseptoria tritici ST99CH_1A5]|uniref:rRNA-processing protein FYV7 n=3 Tax=Zymoseptoria tritici TaxID=1047171 RepID=A0A1X7S4X1_ZYMT9|nr:unnamed protein product [Zymoseptoria tritici ST99CH_3D7]SMR59173.1 unnamed protein product [Zymoseptoria tritici ST99CH_1E4]SMR63010.1 unnamed protein product [Zymoseptoria tritici ST99CH_3D1]SMY28382.1 unnamed protein product [Zymoseptoria tritici ST99CH_1A5]
MSEKRKRDTSDTAVKHSTDRKRQRKGFTVGSENLPDGVHRRKNQAIKQALIDRAKIKKDYAKLRKHANVSDEKETIPQPASMALDVKEDDEAEQEEEPTVAPHPDRQNLMDKEAEEPEVEQQKTFREPRQRRERKPKPMPFRKEHDQAQQRKAQMEEWRIAREAAEKERQAKIEERERFRKAMAKARTGGPNGQRKLGRESNVLLEKVKRMVGSG